jgi:hypothetical protein
MPVAFQFRGPTGGPHHSPIEGDHAMKNLTPHAIVIRTAEGDTTVEPSGSVARVASTETVVPAGTGIAGVDIPVATREWGEVSGLPAEGEPCIVSALVLGRVPGRKGVYAPDTGPTAIRDEKGQIMAVTRLIAA